MLVKFVLKDPKVILTWIKERTKKEGCREKFC